MQSRRDQVNAQSYLGTRLVGALVRADPDVLETPSRRDLRGLVAGIVVAGLMVVGVGGFALLSPGGSTSWRAPGSLVIDKTNGTSYLFLNGELRPVRNVASARLVAGGAVKPVVVAGSRLAHVPRGAPIGLPDGPAILPAADHLNAGVWRACAGDAAGAAVTLDIGGPPAGARVGPDEGVLVLSEGKEYLLWRGQRLLLGRPWAAGVLGYGNVTATPVPAAWLDLVPAGPDLVPVPVPRRGSPGPAIGGHPAPLGQIFSVSVADGPATYYVLLPAGLAPLTPTQLALAQAEEGTAGTRQLTPADLAAAPLAGMPEPQRSLPARPPRISEPAGGAAVCVESPGVPAAAANAAGQTVAAAPTVPADGLRTAASDDTVLDLVLAPRPASPGRPSSSDVGVQVRAGGGALLVPDAALPAKDQQGLLVDGTGTAFPLTPDALKALGYQPEQAVAVPRQLALLPPRGPLLAPLSVP
jgi:type VII secretion protein EccB